MVENIYSFIYLYFFFFSAQDIREKHDILQKEYRKIKKQCSDYLNECNEKGIISLYFLL